MIVYTGNPTTLYVERRHFAEDGRLLSARALDPRLSIVRHSPTGFAWGYWGSGPAQLAFALLADALETEARSAAALEPRTEDGIERTLHAMTAAVRRAANPSLYQEFKQRVVGTWSQVETWSYTVDQVLRHAREIDRDLDLRGAELGTDAGSAR